MYPVSEAPSQTQGTCCNESDEGEWQQPNTEMCKGEPYDLQHAHQDLREDKE